MRSSLRRWRDWMLVISALALVWPLSAFGLEAYGRLGPPRGGFDAIVVAGCRMMPDGRPSRALARRVEGAVGLWSDGRAPVVVFTGGVGVSSTSEADGAAAYARSLGLPESAIRIEDRSHSTEENARFAAEVTNARRIVVVTDAYHAFRCRRVFGRHFEEAHSLGVVGPLLDRLPGMFREVVAVAWYALQGRL